MRLERVLHVVDAADVGWSALAALASLEQQGPEGGPLHEIVILGGTASEHRAARAGVASGVRVAVPAGRFGMARRGLEALLARRARHDVIACWGAGALIAAGREGRRYGGVDAWGTPRVGVLTSGPSLRRAGLISRLSGARRRGRDSVGVRLIAGSRGVREAWGGAVAGRWHHEPLALPADVLPANAEHRQQMRRAWGVEPGTAVVVALGEPESAIDASSFAYHCGVIAVAGVPVLGVVPPGSFDVERGLRFTERHHGTWRIAIDDRPPWELLHGCDAGVWLGGPGAWVGFGGLRWAAGAGLAVIASEHAMAHEALGAYEGATIVPREPNRLFTRALLDVLRASADRGARFEPWAPMPTPLWRQTLERVLAEAAAQRLASPSRA